MPLTYQPFAETPRLNELRRELTRNVPQSERTISIVAGTALALFSLSRRALGGTLLALAGGALILRGVTGHCKVYEALGVNSPEGGAAIENEDSPQSHVEPARAKVLS